MAEPAPGVCLTFDDLNVANWCRALPLLSEHGAVVTFCVSGLHSAAPEQIEGLHQLQTQGHEIGFHTRTHPRLRPYLSQHGLSRWLSDEIDAGVIEHRRLGFPATSFACPFHASTRATRKATGQRFEITRCSGPRGVHAGNLPQRIVARPGRHRAVNNVGLIDFRHPAQGGWDWLKLILDTIAATGGVGIFTGHDIRGDARGSGFYSTPDEIAALLSEITTRGLRFYSLTGFARQSDAG